MMLFQNLKELHIWHQFLFHIFILHKHNIIFNFSKHFFTILKLKFILVYLNILINLQLIHM